MKDRRRAFSVVELLVVVGVLALLAGILLPVVARAREAARQVQCSANLRSLLTAWNLYGTLDKKVLPVPTTEAPWPSLGRSISWVSVGDDEKSITQGTLHCYLDRLSDYRCPSDPTPRVRSYSINAHIGPDYRTLPRVETLAQLRDAGQTMVFVEERDPQSAFNLNGFDVPLAGETWNDFPANFHRNRSNLGFADGHVELYVFKDPRTGQLQAKGTPSAGNGDLRQFQDWLGVKAEVRREGQR